jgi:chemosensory pili system protein ChpA (sensor histidine kinase/response regulator)
MEDSKDRAFLLSLFLMEAWDTLASVEQGLAALASGADADFETLLLVTHRLRGAAGLNGFPRVAALATVMESTVERTAAASPAGRPAMVAPLGELAKTLKEALETIGATGVENATALDAVLARHGTPGAAAASEVEGPLNELDRFFRENPDVLEYFVPEATEHLELMAQSLLTLEREGSSDAEVATLFRAVHTLKGAGYTVGCQTIGALAHSLEDLLGEIREHRRSLTPATLEAVYAGMDALRLMVRSAEGVLPGRAEALTRARSLLQEQAQEPAQESVQAAPAVQKPTPAPAAPVAAPAVGPPPAVALPAAMEMVVSAPKPAESTIRPEVAPLAARPAIRVNLDRLDSLMNLAGELVIARSRLERRLTQLDRVGMMLGFTEARMRQTIGSFEAKYANPQLPGADDSNRPGAPGVEAAGAAAVPLDAVFAELEFDRYDDFNLLARRVGEITADVTEVQGQLSQMIRGVREDASRMQQLSGQLRSQITRARMVPIGRLFARFTRQAREAARAAGKAVAFEVSGEAVELDNTVVEQISDSLLHLVQNAIAHGIESEAERRASGKPAQGSVRVSAVQKGSAIVVEVADDGRGIDLESVKATALRNRLVTPEVLARLSDLDVLDFIFRPGFSTAATVTVAAGRGVGLDVVQTNVARLGGEVEVETTAGQGTRFSLRLPLTVAVSYALMVRVGSEVLAIPAPAVRGMVEVSPEEITATDGGGESVIVDAQPLDLVRLDKVLGLTSSRPAGTVPVVALRTARKAVAVTVDELLGREEIVIKSLGAFLDGVGPFSGATVTGEGRVILLLDSTRLFDSVSSTRLVSRPAGEESRPVAAPAPRPRRTVLLVDDSVSIRKFVGQMLDRAGFRVITANDGMDALDRLNADPAVHVVVTDLEMPRLNGFELIRDIRRRPGLRDVPVVVLTTRAGEKHVNLARQLGVEHYVTKPVDAQSFVQLIDGLAVPEPAMPV